MYQDMWSPLVASYIVQQKVKIKPKIYMIASYAHCPGVSFQCVGYRLACLISSVVNLFPIGVGGISVCLKYL